MAHRSAGQSRGQSVFRTLIVDDEPTARRVLRDDLAAYSDIEIVAKAERAVSAVGFDSTAHARSGISRSANAPNVEVGCNLGGAAHDRNNRRRDCVQGWSFNAPLRTYRPARDRIASAPVLDMRSLEKVQDILDRGPLLCGSPVL